jgi:hypothetical protein
VTLETKELAGPEDPRLQGGRRVVVATLVAFLVPALAGALAVFLGHRFAKSAIVDIGPTDSHYVSGFRDIERDGSTYFRWTSIPSSGLTLPFRVCGPGMLRARVRRHFVDPALISVSVSGTVIGQRSIGARQDHPYEVTEFQIPKVSCDSQSTVVLEASVENTRPLGVALDWLEIRGQGALRASPETLARGALFLGLTGLAVVACGGGAGALIALDGGLFLVLGFGFTQAPVAAERMLRGGLVALTLTLALGAAIAWVTGVRTLAPRFRVALLAITVATLLSRSAFLHTQAFYPDYRVHALVQQTLNRAGLPLFLEHLFETQYARSLGLQQIGGNWYPFPYPPGAYILARGVGNVFSLDPLDAALATAVTAASLIPLLTATIGLSLGLGPSVGSMGALYVFLQPLLVRRMALGYFPGLSGQLFDALTLLCVLAAFRRGASPARLARAALCLLGALLVYTQSIANFGLFLGALILMELARQSPGGRAAAVRIALAATLALAASSGLFYSRYLPVLENIEHQRPQPESRVLDRLEQMRAQTLDQETPEAEDLNDQFAGPTFNPLRGLTRLLSRLWRFNGPFLLLLVVGGSQLLKGADRPTQNILVAWSAVAVGISVLAAGLPSPNGFQHLKDLEFVSPLLALAMASANLRLRRHRLPLASMVVVGWVIFAVAAFLGEWAERLLPLGDL